MEQSKMLANAWLYVCEEEQNPHGTNYFSSNNCYQRLITKNVYQCVDMLFISLVTTVAVEDGKSYTIEIKKDPHPPGYTNQEYMDYIIRDARKNNPGIKILVTLEFGNEGDPSTGNIIERVFSIPGYSPQQNAQNFASNLMRYLEKYDLDGFDIDWEDPLSTVTTKEHFGDFINAIGALFKQQTEKKYYLTISPAVADNMDYTAINNNVDFVNLQLYSGFTYPSDFSGINGQLLAYGAKFEATEPVTNPAASGYQTAQQAFQDNNENYHYSIFTNWRLNSENFEFEQDQQKALHELVQS